MLLSLLPIQAANMFVMHNSMQITFPLPYLHNLQSLTRQGCLFIFGSDILTNTSMHKGSQYFDDVLLSLHSPWIMQDTTPEIIDDLMTFIFRIRQLLCHFFICLSRLPICW